MTERSLEERVGSLEQECRALRGQNRGLRLALITFILLAIGGAVFALFVQFESNEVRTRNLLIVDDQGNVRARLGQGQLFEYFQGIGLAVYNEAGDPRATLALSPTGPGLDFYDRNINKRVSLSQELKKVRLDIFDRFRRRRMSLVNQEDLSYLELLNSSNQVQSFLAQTDSGAIFELYDTNETARATLGQTADGPVLGFFDAEGMPIYRIPDGKGASGKSTDSQAQE